MDAADIDIHANRCVTISHLKLNSTGQTLYEHKAECNVSIVANAYACYGFSNSISNKCRCFQQKTRK